MTSEKHRRLAGIPQQTSSTLTLPEARELAASDKTSWCIVPLGFDLTVAKLDIDDGLCVRRIRDASGRLMRFPSIQEARQFLLDTLGISRTMLLPA